MTENTQVPQSPIETLQAENKQLKDTIDTYIDRITALKFTETNLKNQYVELYDKIEAFLKEHIVAKDIDTQDLVKFAADLDMELTKTVKVEFAVVCEYQFNVPLSYDESDFSEGDFDIKISSNITDDNVEETHESFEVQDFEVNDND
jgi:uncharacterized protein YdcH (DUF465 family)